MAKETKPNKQLQAAQDMAQFLGMPEPVAPKKRKVRVGGGRKGRKGQRAQEPTLSPQELHAKMQARQAATPQAVLQDWLQRNMVYARPNEWGVPEEGTIPANAFGPEIMAALPQDRTAIGVPSHTVTPEVQQAALAMQPAPEQVSQEALMQMYLPLVQSALSKVRTAPQPVGAGGGGIPLSAMPPQLLAAAGAQPEAIPHMWLDPQQLSPQELAALMALKGG